MSWIKFPSRQRGEEPSIALDEPADPPEAVAVETASTRPGQSGWKNWKSRIAARKAATKPGSAANASSRFKFALPGNAGNRWLLLTWDITGMSAILVDKLGKVAPPQAVAHSSEATFAAAIVEVIEKIRADGHKLPRKVAIAARHLRPAVVDLPVNPDKPRPAAQMQELLRSDMEPVLAEFASLWTMGALLHARQHISASDRDRVVVEEAMRREERRAPLRYGETALELALIDRATLNECLEMQESLQLLDSDILCACTGWVEHGERHWLGGALNGTFYQQWKDSLAKHGLQLDTVLPLGWLCSEEGDEAPAADEPDQHAISLELHSEEILAVRRERGRITASRADGRMERPLQADWLLRLIEDWINEARSSLTLVCLTKDDEEVASRVASDLELTTGHAVRVLSGKTTSAAIWSALARETAAPPAEQRLPRLALRDLRIAPWKNPDVLRAGALVGVMLAVLGIEVYQHYQVRALQKTMSERSKQEGETQKRTQIVLQMNAEMQGVAKELAKAGSALEPLINTQTRLEAIANMRRYLPDLITMLAQSVGEDAVLEKISSSRYGQDATSIRVEAWSTTYTGAQAFVNRVAAQTHSLNYGVSQTEILEDKGRTNKTGYRVGFWLMQEQDDLESDAPAQHAGMAQPTPRPSAPGAAPAGGISSRSGDKP